MTAAQWRAIREEIRHEQMEFMVEMSYLIRDAVRTARESRARAAELRRASCELRRRARELARSAPR